MNFTKFRDAVTRQIALMQQTNTLFRAAMAPDTIWELYLASFPEGTNPMFRERTEHDCSCCKQFIRNAGSMLAIIDGELVSAWDVRLDDDYQVVANALSAAVKESGIDTVWLHDQPSVGVAKNHEHLESGEVKTWEHFQTDLSRDFYKRDGSIARRCGDARTDYQVLKRSLEEITSDSIDIVLELISQKSLYRGEEHKPTLSLLKETKKSYRQTSNPDLYLWEKSTQLGRASGFRNTVIGTLLMDISEGIDLDAAVGKFTDKVAPHNYKRPSSVVTQSMIKKAQEKVQQLGLENALQRRYATIDDLTINNVLFADRSTPLKSDDIFNDLAQSVPEKLPNFDKVEEIFVEKFLEEILPNATSVEVLFENKHAGNLVSLIAPVNPDAPNILKWDNNFSWSYAGEVTDSVKERVKAAGGNIEADVRISLSWHNLDDLDLSVIEPGGHKIYFGNRRVKSPSGGQLDVDMNAGSGTTREPVENITYDNLSTMREGTYKVVVHNYAKRESIDVGFSIEMEIMGELHTIDYSNAVRNNDRITVVEFTYSKKDGVTVHSATKSKPIIKEHWGINTSTFHKVDAIMSSPNHWDGEHTGNEHVFFMLANCANPEKARGLYNEFLRDDLNEHRKVFEVLGSKLKTPEADNQLSGLGFSTTQQNSVICRVSGSFNRVLKVVF